MSRYEPAFPYTQPWPTEGAVRTYSGLTIRDWFAAAAVQGILASPREPQGSGRHNVMSDDLANLAYAVADSMLTKREKS